MTADSLTPCHYCEKLFDLDELVAVDLLPDDPEHQGEATYLFCPDCATKME
jgi:hypothetical protein